MLHCTKTRVAPPVAKLGLFGLVLAWGWVGLGCSGDSASGQIAVPGHAGAAKTAAQQRALRRAFDGAPPVIAHEPLGIECTECHNDVGKAVDGLGYAPPSPHAQTEGMSLISRCTQCHVFSQVDTTWVANGFVGLQQDLRRGDRLATASPPRIPHEVFMRENCMACHTGPAAREEIRCSHPERVRCLQCHVPSVTTETFEDRL